MAVAVAPARLGTALTGPAFGFALALRFRQLRIDAFVPPHAASNLEELCQHRAYRWPSLAARRGRPRSAHCHRPAKARGDANKGKSEADKSRNRPGSDVSCL